MCNPNQTKDKLKLYYDVDTHIFSITSTNNCVFETHQREGLANGGDIILQPPFRIEVKTNFYPKAPNREYIYVNIYINDILLLPVSKAWRNVSSHNMDIAKDIFIEEWGNNTGVVNCYPQSPSTIVLLRKYMKGEELCWYDVLSSICQICNNCRTWITNEVEMFVNETKKRQNIHWRRLSSAISLIRTYDILVPELNEIYRPVFDSKVLSAVQSMCKSIEQMQISEEPSQNRIPQQEANVLWKYLTDYLF